jgi:hypothetical protein
MSKSSTGMSKRINVMSKFLYESEDHQIHSMSLSENEMIRIISFIKLISKKMSINELA